MLLVFRTMSRTSLCNPRSDELLVRLRPDRGFSNQLLGSLKHLSDAVRG